MSVSIYGAPEAPPADEPCEVIETTQWLNLRGLTIAEAFAHATGLDRVIARVIAAGQDCPWAKTWYRLNERGVLELWRANWDSSG
jgi:hypothetical protein